MSAPIQINLVSGRAFELKHERVLKAKIQFVTAFVLVCFAGLMVVILGVSALNNLRLDQVKAAALNEEQRIEQLAFKEDTYILLQNKVALLDKYFNQNKEILDGLDYIISSRPKEIEVSKIELNNEKMTIRWELSAPTYEALNQFLDYIQVNIDTQKFKRVDLEKTARNDQGMYGAKLLMEYLP